MTISWRYAARITRPLMLLAFLALFGAPTVVTVGCGHGDGDSEDEGEMLEDEPDDAGRSALVAPPVEITEQDVTRVIAALLALRPQVEALHVERYPDASARPPLKIGADIASFLGPKATPILRREGFASAEEFDALLANVLVAWQRVQLGETGGFDSGERTFTLRSARQAQEESLRKLGEDQTIAPTERRKREREIKAQIDEIDEQLAEISDRSLALKSRFDNVPRKNLEAVTKHKAELARLFAPR